MKQKLWKICVCGVLKFNDEYLVLKRSDEDEDMAGFWEFPSGNAECGEDLYKALIREIKEETGISIKKDKVKLCSFSQYESEKIDYIKCSVQLNFLINLKQKEDVYISEEHTDYKWVKATDPEIDEFLKEIIKSV